MENPVKEIEGVIRTLVTSKPSTQRSAIRKYFTPDAYFIHPFCRTGTFDNSRYLIEAIYRWYKIMSPTIELQVKSIAFDEPNLILYANISQNFRLWAAPGYQAPVELTTVLRLRYDQGVRRYYIASQNDLYQVDQFARFLYPGIVAAYIVYVWHAFATFASLIGTWVFYPITVLEEKYGELYQQTPNNQPTIFNLIGLIPILFSNAPVRTPQRKQVKQ